MEKNNLYYSLANEAEDIDDILKDLIDTRNKSYAGKAIGVIEGEALERSIGALDNVVTKTNISLSPILEKIKDGINGEQTLVLQRLPENGCMYRVADDSGLKTIKSIEITDVESMDYSQNGGIGDSIDVTHDYYCTFIFKKEESIGEPVEVMKNFTDGSDEDGASIKLLNPDLDISDYSIIHLLLFNDSENICALISGY